MKTLEWRNVDKSAWGPGPWQEEPDAVQWQDEATSLPCLVLRSHSSGALCGYVGINEEHPFFGKSHDEIEIDVHGGLTYSNFCFGEPGDGICHLPDPGEPERIYWLGFDCAHAWDVMPRLRALAPLPDELRDPEDVYRDLAYVKAECVRLAAQLKEREK